MLNIRKLGSISLALITLISLTACHPRVAPSSDMDKQLNCAELSREIDQVKTAKNNIDKTRGLSLRNAGLALIFWPGIIINEITGESAEQEANAKLVALQNIYAKKQCAHVQCTDVAQTNQDTKKG